MSNPKQTYPKIYDEEVIQRNVRETARLEGMEEGIKKGMEKGIEKGIKKGMEEGIEKGIKKGMEKGIEKGIKKGIKKGMEEGEIKRAREIAITLIEKGFDNELISEATRLKIEQIEEIRKESGS